MHKPLVKIEIVIPVYNRREITLQALRSLERIDKTGLDIHIIIVDDASKDGTSEAIRKQFPEVQLVQGDGKLHYAAGTNRGISAALERNPSYVLVMNDDAVFHDQFLQRLIKTAIKNPHSIIASLLLLWNEPHKVFQVDFKWKTLSGGWTVKDNLTAFDFPAEAFEVEGLAGNCVLIPVEAIRECGLLDEKKFPHGWGDIQYFVRLKKMGWKLMVEPKSFIWCEPNTYPKPLHQISVREMFKTLFRNRRHPLNFQRQFIARWESAPNKFQAFIAFEMYSLSLLGKTLKMGLNPNHWKRSKTHPSPTEQSNAT